MGFRKTRAMGVAVVAAALALGGCTGGQEDNGLTSDGIRPTPMPGDVTISFFWSGDETRNQLTQKAVSAFMGANPGITVQVETSDSRSYYSKLEAKFADGRPPDVMQLDDAHFGVYADQGKLLDLEASGVSLPHYTKAAVESGRVDGKFYGAVFGAGVPVIVANKALFDSAKVSMPNDKTWTWDDFASVAKKIGAAGAADYSGTASMITQEMGLQLWLRQHNSSLYGESGVAASADDVASWYQYWLGLQSDGGTLPADASVADATATVQESAFAQGKVAMTLTTTTQVELLDFYTGQDLVLLRPPSQTGKAKDADSWLQATSYLAVAQRSDYQDAAMKLVEFLAASPDAASILGTNRGMPSSRDNLDSMKDSMSASDKKVATFMDSVSKELGAHPTFASADGGTADLLLQYGGDVLSAKTAPAAAGSGFVTDLQKAMSG